MKPIETVYKGYRFRSRLEARYAVFFDALGVPWEYEKEGYDLDGVWYLPDFWLPQQDCWIEIKGQVPTPDEFNKAFLLAWHSGKPVYILFGEVGNQELGPYRAYTFGWVSWTICSGNWQVNTTTTYKDLYTLDRFKVPPIKNVEDLANNLHEMLIGLLKREQESSEIELGELHVFFPLVEWIECPHCHKISIIGDVHSFPKGTCKCAEVDGWTYTTQNIERAYTAARQARFEHGETPRF